MTLGEKGRFKVNATFTYINLKMVRIKHLHFCLLQFRKKMHGIAIKFSKHFTPKRITLLYRLYGHIMTEMCRHS